MSFTLAQYEATMDKLSSTMTDLSDKLDKVENAVKAQRNRR